MPSFRYLMRVAIATSVSRTIILVRRKFLIVLIFIAIGRMQNTSYRLSLGVPVYHAVTTPVGHLAFKSRSLDAHGTPPRT